MTVLDTLFESFPGIRTVGYLIVVIIFIYILFATFRTYYVVVPPQQAHVLVNNRGRSLRMSGKEDEGVKSTYFYIPFLMTRNILPMEQIPIAINEMSLNDKEFAPFRCDIVAWLVVNNPILAAERIGDIITDQELRTNSKDEVIQQVSHRLSRDIRPLIASVSRTASMKLTIQQIFQDRKQFSIRVEEDIDISLQKWGLSLTDLEVLHIEDDPPSEGESRSLVIANLEKTKAKELEAAARKEVAERDREARIAESENNKEAELTEAMNEEEWRKRHIQKDQEIQIQEQQKELAVQDMVQKANEKKVEAERTYTVGKADYEADASVKTAEGERQSVIARAEGNKQRRLLEADAESEFTRMTGVAQGDAIEATKKGEAEGEKAMLLANAEGTKQMLLGEAEGLDKKADAQAKLQDSAVIIEMINAAKDIEIAKYQYLSEGIKGASTQIVAGGMTELFGQPFGPQQGAGLGVTLSTLYNNLPEEVKNSLPDNVKKIIKEGSGEE